MSNLKEVLESQEIIIRDLDASNAALQADRERLREDLERAERRAAASEATIMSRHAEIGRLTEMLVRTKMEVARKEGYIDRVREIDVGGIVSTPVRNPAAGGLDPFMMEDVRNAMAQADDDGFDRIVSSMSEATLNKVMGKNQNEQSDILR